jgi:hypothetical protein
VKKIKGMILITNRKHFTIVIVEHFSCFDGQFGYHQIDTIEKILKFDQTLTERVIKCFIF